MTGNAPLSKIFAAAALAAVPTIAAAQCVECSQATQFAYPGAVTQSNALNKAYGWDRATNSRGTSSGSSVGMAAKSFAPPRRAGASIRLAYLPTDLRALRLTEAGFVSR